VRSRIPSTARRGAIGLLALVAVTAGCGIPEDSKPREISRAALPPELIDPTADTGATSDDQLGFVTLYLVKADDSGEETLVAVRRAVPVPTDAQELPRAITDALIAASPEEIGRTDLVNAVPSDVQVRSAVVDDDGVLALDLTNLGNVENALQRLAVAQIIFTLTDLGDPPIRAIRFSVDGEEVAVPVEGGVAGPGTAVSRADERSLEDVDPAG
jgi:spore germination protein GerM